MSTAVSTPSSESPSTRSGSSSDQESLHQLDQELVVAERIRDYSDEIYMYTRQQWIDWKERVDAERAAASRTLKANGGHHHHHPQKGHANGASAGTQRAPTRSANGKHQGAPTLPNPASKPGEAVKTRQEPFNFYAPTSPVSELAPPASEDY